MTLENSSLRIVAKSSASVSGSFADIEILPFLVCRAGARRVAMMAVRPGGVAGAARRHGRIAQVAPSQPGDRRVTGALAGPGQGGEDDFDTWTCRRRVGPPPHLRTAAAQTPRMTGEKRQRRVDVALRAGADDVESGARLRATDHGADAAGPGRRPGAAGQHGDSRRVAAGKLRAALDMDVAGGVADARNAHLARSARLSRSRRTAAPDQA
jgi:hypothetical protein